MDDSENEVPMKHVNVIALNEFGGLQALYCNLSNGLLSRGIGVSTINRARSRPAEQIINHSGLRDDITSPAALPLGRLKWSGIVRARRFLGQLNLAHRIRREVTRSKTRRVILWNALPYAAYLVPGSSMVLYDHGLSSIQKPTRAKRDSLNDIERIICVSHANKHLLRERWQYRGQIDVLPNPLRPDISITAPAEPKRLRETPVIGCAARLVPVKGIASLIHAVAILRDRGIAVQLKIAGDGPELGILIEVVQKLDMESIVEFQGHVEDIGSFYNSIDIFIAPSLREPFGLSVLEAMAHSLPVILSNIDGHPEAVTYTDAAIFIEPTLSIQDYCDLGASSENIPSSVYSPTKNSIVETQALCPMVLSNAIEHGMVNYTALSDAAFRASKKIPEDFSFDTYVDRYVGMVT